MENRTPKGNQSNAGAGAKSGTSIKEIIALLRKTYGPSIDEIQDDEDSEMDYPVIPKGINEASHAKAANDKEMDKDATELFASFYDYETKEIESPSPTVPAPMTMNQSMGIKARINFCPSDSLCAFEEHLEIGGGEETALLRGGECHDDPGIAHHAPCLLS